MSVWTSLPLLGDAVFIQMFDVPLSSLQRAIKSAVGALTGYEQFALVVVASISVALTVASLATLAALWARYPRRLNIAGLLLLLFGLALVLLALGQRWNAARRDPPGDVLGSRVSDRACDRLSPLAGVRGAASDAASGVWRRAGLGCIRGGMPDASAWGGCVAGRNVRGGRGVDAVAGAPAADGRRPGALVAQPHSTYVTPGRDQRRRAGGT